MRGWWASARAAARRLASGASPRVSFSGLPGVTSHHTRSRPSRRIAIRQAARCARCGGSKVPPNRPMRRPRACGGRVARTTGIRRATAKRSRPGLPGAAHAILEAGELLDADRAARVEAAGRNADLGAEAELAAVGELRGGIVQHD